jgi:hypothetical protein
MVLKPIAKAIGLAGKIQLSTDEPHTTTDQTQCCNTNNSDIGIAQIWLQSQNGA